MENDKDDADESDDGNKNENDKNNGNSSDKGDGSENDSNYGEVIDLACKLFHGASGGRDVRYGAVAEISSDIFYTPSMTISTSLPIHLSRLKWRRELFAKIHN